MKDTDSNDRSPSVSTELTREQFLARCANAWDCGKVSQVRLLLLSRLVEAMLRLEGGQVDIFSDILYAERRRTNHFHGTSTLANDPDGYALTEFLAILTHHCDACATSKSAWWTRAAFCEHRS